MTIKRLVLAAALLSLGGCTSVQVERAWTTSWALVATPVHVACTPYNALWDGGLSLIDPGFLEHGVTSNSWRAWWDSVRGESTSWGAPVVLVALPLVTILQPLPDLLWAAAVAHMGG